MEKWIMKAAYEKYLWMKGVINEANAQNGEVTLTAWWQFNRDIHWLPSDIRGQIQLAIFWPQQFQLLEWK